MTVLLQNGQLTWDIPFNPAAEAVTLIPEWSTDMVTWQPASALFASDVRTGGLRKLTTGGPVAERRILLRVRVVQP